MKNKTTYLFTVLLCSFALSCTDIFEIDLQQQKVKLLTPQDNLLTTEIVHEFLWEEVEGALEYRLQIVSPSWESLEKVVLDTLIPNAKFNHTLYSSEFTWRVKAVNGSSETPYTKRALQVDSILEVLQDTVLLLSPYNNDTTAIGMQVFSWESLYNAELYNFQLLDTNNSPLVDVILSVDSFAYSLAEGRYKWQVQIFNQQGTGATSELRIFTVQ
jgi:hypothetical protein